MPTVKFTKALKRFFPTLEDTLEVKGNKVKDIIGEIDALYPGLAGYIVDEQGQLRKHVNIFINSQWIEDELTLSDAVGKNDEIFIIQALSGG